MRYFLTKRNHLFNNNKCLQTKITIKHLCTPSRTHHNRHTHTHTTNTYITLFIAISYFTLTSAVVTSE